MSLPIICYRETDGNIPFQNFLARYVPTEKDKIKQKIKKMEVLTKTKKWIHHLAENDGVPREPTASPLRGYPFHEIKVDFPDKLIRIQYFCYNQEKLIILNAYEKPTLYDKARKRTTDRVINSALEEAKKCHEDFINNPQNHEEYEKI